MSQGSEQATSDVVIGVDVGTTAAKVSAFSTHGTWRYTSVREYPLLHPYPGWEVQRPRVIVDAVFAALSECVTACQGRSVDVIAVSSAMHGLLGLDVALQPLTDLVTWADSRSVDEARELKGTELGDGLHRTSGTPMHSMTPLTKLMWFARNEPQLCRRVRHWVGLKDYVLLHLTGTLATELSCASGTGMLDMATRTWNPRAVAVAGLELDQLPVVLPTTAALGLDGAVGQRIGLPAGTPVVVGAGDGPLGNLGVGALVPGVAGLSLGTSGALRMVTDRPHVDESGRLFCYALTEDAWVTGGAVSNGGVVVRWAADVFGEHGSIRVSQAHVDEELLALAAQVPAGSDGLVMLPYLLAERAPLWNPEIAGAYLGVRSWHTRAHFVRAALEGVALQLSTILDVLDTVAPVTQVRATGGVFRSTLWRDIVAGVLDRPLVVTDGAEGSALGAAALGLLGIGMASNLADALAMLSRPDAGQSEPTTAASRDVDAYRRLRAAIPPLLDSYADVRSLFC